MKSLYGTLTQINFASAINQAVEDLFPRGTKDKVLVVNVRMSADHYEKNQHEFKEINLLFERSSNYTFVGHIEGDISTIPGSETPISFLSYHDSCWRSDGTEHIMRKYAEEISDKFTSEDEVEVRVYNSFGIFGFRIFSGRIDKDRDNRTAKFVVIKEKSCKANLEDNQILNICKRKKCHECDFYN
jgi:hypothetical protein